MSVDTIVQVLHNPGAGTGTLSREKLLNLLAAEGWSCSYSSVKEDKWEVDPDARIVIIAGGDGTIRKVCKKIIGKGSDPVIGLLPAGTANNIGATLQMNGNIKSIIRSWKFGDGNKIHFDSGEINNADFKSFFIESVGVGLFPEMVKNMGDGKTKKKQPVREKLKDSLRALYETSLTHEPRYCYLKIDGKDYSDEYNLVEIMNISFVGPNILLNPHASVNDGLLDVVIARADEKEKTTKYLHNKLLNGRDECPLQIIRGKEIQLKWSGEDIHLDDKLIQVDPGSLTEIISQHDSFTFFNDKHISNGKEILQSQVL